MSSDTGLGSQCAAYACYNWEYMVENGEIVKTDIHFVNFPKETAI